jgi:hypothetical protein
MLTGKHRRTLQHVGSRRVLCTGVASYSAGKVCDSECPLDAACHSFKGDNLNFKFTEVDAHIHSTPPQCWTPCGYLVQALDTYTSGPNHLAIHPKLKFMRKTVTESVQGGAKTVLQT